MQHRTTCLILVISLGIAVSAQAQQWELTGGPPWENRVGPGIMLAIGGNDCTDDFCDDVWDTSFFGSIAGTVGFFYRIIPNVVVLVEIHTGYIKTDAGWVDNDKGFLFEVTPAAEFHGPITGWLDTFIGLGVGFAYLGFWGEDFVDTNMHHSLRGLNFEVRTGVDVYPFSKVPNLGGGVLFRLGLSYWPKMCVEVRDADECDEPDDLSVDHNDDLPFLVHLGLTVKYGF